MQIITLSGVDGSGKSTQLERLRIALNQQGQSVVYFHAVSFSLLEMLRTKVFGTRSASQGAARTKSTSFGVFLRKVFLLIDLWRFRCYLKQQTQSGTQYLLSDRYFYDTLINIAYLDGTSLNTSYVRFALRFIVTPDLAFCLRVTPERVMQRDRVPEQGLQYLKDKTSLFEEATGRFGLIPLNADLDVDTVSATLQKFLTTTHPTTPQS